MSVCVFCVFVFRLVRAKSGETRCGALVLEITRLEQELLQCVRLLVAVVCFLITFVSLAERLK